MSRTRLWLLTAATFAAFLLLALLAALLLHPRGRGWVLLAGVVLLGLVAAILLHFYLRWRAGPATAGAGVDDAVDAAASAARARLSAAGSPGRLPAVLLLGPSGSSKSTIVMESGLEPELVAGEARRGTSVPAAVNVWYAQGTVFVEAAGSLLGEPRAWQRLLRHFRPRRLAAALTGRPQAPRVALVCYPCDELLQPGAAQAVPAAAQVLRERLLEAARQFGVRLPVYVLFTRADRFPHFNEYVRSLSREEAQEVLGATLPAQEPGPAALHVEREASRVAGAFGELIRSLSLRRSDLLAREVDEVVRATAYEFPRDLRKASDVAAQFLVELTRPSHLGISAFLRGFYFTGVRPIVVDDGAAPVIEARPDAVLAATGVFDARTLQAAGAPAAAAPRGGRRVPEWVFLRRLFPEVILADRAAAGATARGSRVHALRRTGLAAASVLCLILSAGFVTSFVSNRRLEGAAGQALRDVPAGGEAVVSGPSTDALRRLDALRQVAGRLRDYDLNGAPLHLRWGLFTGSALLPGLRRAYFQDFDRLLWRATRRALLDSLQALPPAPDATSGYGPTRDALEAHLVTTSFADSSTGSFLAPILLRFWRDPTPDAGRKELVRQQFEFFGAELPFGNPFADAPDLATIRQARAFLAQFGDQQRVYAALLAEANARAPAIQFSRLVPDAAPAVRNDVVIPGAFTRPAWAYVQARLRDVSGLFNAQPWVVGPAAAAPSDQARLARALADQYAADYVSHWLGYLTGTSVGGLSSPDEASRTLARLGDPQSPLLRLLALAAANTAVDTNVVARAFQPVRAVVPAAATDKPAGGGNMPYLQGLQGEKAALDQVLAAPPGQRAGMTTQLGTAVDQARGAVLQLSQGFPMDGSAGEVGTQVRRLLELPVNGLGGLLQGLPSADANGKGQDFCRAQGKVLARYPFNARSSADATLDQVAQLFLPGNNAFTGFASGLQDMIVPQGTGYAEKVGANPRPSPAFISFLNRAANISRSLYEPDGTGPRVVFTLTPQTSADLPEVTISIDGQIHTFTRTNTASYTFTWDGSRSPHEARVSGRIHGVDTPLVQGPPGTWALFRMLQQADWQRSGAGWTLRWHLGQGGELTADIAFARGVPVFKSDFFGGLSCVSEVAR